MGSGPATHLAATRNPACLLLMSAFKSIRSIAEDQAGSILKYLIQERFNNEEKIKKVTCPTFIIHGLKDNLIPYSHSKILHDNCSGPCSLVLPENMDHNEFDYCDSLITPFYQFMNSIGISTSSPSSSHAHNIIPDEYMSIPKVYQAQA